MYFGADISGFLVESRLDLLRAGLYFLLVAALVSTKMIAARKTFEGPDEVHFRHLVRRPRQLLAGHLC
jgi:hypothetical protein